MSQATIHRDTLNELRARRFFSPDYKDKIDLYDKQVVMVWDNLKVGFPQASFLENEIFLGEAYTLEKCYIMRISPNSPIIWRETNVYEQNKKFATRVWGHAYAVSREKMVFLDALNDNRNSLQRHKTWIALDNQTTPFKDDRRVTVESWCYEATPFYRGQIEPGTVGATQVKHQSSGLAWEWRASQVLAF